MSDGPVVVSDSGYGCGETLSDGRGDLGATVLSRQRISPVVGG